jgi:hypothetical protein
MDYADGTILFKQQWDAMYDEQALLFSWLQDEEEGQSPLLATHEQYVKRLIELFRCAYVNDGSFSLPSPAYKFFFKDQIGAEVKLNDIEYFVYVIFEDDINNFHPTIKSWYDHPYDGLPSLKFENFRISIKSGDYKTFNNYLYPEKENYSTYSNKISQNIKSLIASSQIEEAVDLLFEMSSCAIDGLTFEEKFALIEYIAGLAIQEDRIDYTLLQILSSISEKDGESEKFIEKASTNLLCNLYVGTDDENTRELFMNELLVIFSEKWKGKEIVIDDHRKYFTRDRLGYYSSTKPRIDRNFIHYGFNVPNDDMQPVYVPCGPLEPVALVEYAKTKNEEDIMIYVPALYMEHLDLLNEKEQMQAFITGALKAASVFSSAGLLLRGASAVQKIIAVAELANVLTNEILNEPTIRAKIAARPNGIEFLEAWPTISTVTDLTTISVAALDLFSKSGRQILAECYDNIPEAERLYIKSKIDECEGVIIKSIDNLPVQIKQIVNSFDDEATKINFVSDYFDDASEHFRRAIDGNPELLKSWKVLDDAGETGLSGRIDDIAKVHDYLKSNPTKTAQNVVDDIKTNGWQKWYDDLLKNEFLSKVGKELPENWNKFSLENNVEFAERLKAFRGNDDLTFDADFRGGEGQLFDSPLSDDLVLKRWFSSRVKDMPESIRLLKEAENLLKTNHELGKLIDVVTVGERGTDWVVRGFKAESVPLKSVASDPLVAKARQEAIDILSKQSGEISANILKKLNKNSANVHWAPIDQKLLIIDMQ